MKACEHAWKADALEEDRLSESEAASLQRHARACSSCRDRLQRGRRLRSLAERLPVREPGELPLRRARERLLAAADARTYARPRPALRWAAVFAGVLALVGLFMLRRTSRAPHVVPWSGAVTATAGAVWSQARAAGVETVRLTDGALRIVVRKQGPEERFVVETPDGELEVHGTTFEVVVAEQATRRVRVLDGVVAVRLQGRAPFDLGAGQAWGAPVPEAIAAPAPDTPPVDPPATTTPAPTAAHLAMAVAPATSAPPMKAARRPSTELADYESAMRLYQSARYDDAAAAFRAFSARHRDSGLNEDATFLEALALTKAGHSDAGSVAAWRHLAEFPSSFHAKEASILVARAARDRGDCKEAKRVLGTWMGGSQDPAVRDALGGCE